MARPLHWCGVFLLFVSAALLLVTTLSAPVFGDIAILKVTLTNRTNIRYSSVTFGSFGHCILDVPPVQTDQDYCSPKTIGYKPARLMEQIDGQGFNLGSALGADVLTNALVLHPVAAGLTLIAFLLALIPGFIGAILGSTVTALAWVVALVVMAIDFALFGIIKSHVNNDGSGSHAYYSIGMWTLLAAVVILFFTMFIVLFSCFQHRRDRGAGTRTVRTQRTTRRTTSRRTSREY